MNIPQDLTFKNTTLMDQLEKHSKVANQNPSSTTCPFSIIMGEGNTSSCRGKSCVAYRSVELPGYQGLEFWRCQMCVGNGMNWFVFQKKP